MIPDKGPHLAVAGTIVALCLLLRAELERDPVSHLLLQLPALAGAGWLAAEALRDRFHAFDRINDGGVVGTLIALFTAAFWMLPRSIDAALDHPTMEVLKFLSIPCLLGLPLALSWRRLHPLVRGLLKANALSMLGVLAFLFSHAPVRLCNSYMESDQERVGIGFLIVAFVLAAAWSLPLILPPAAGPAAHFVGRQPASPRRP